MRPILQSMLVMGQMQPESYTDCIRVREGGGLVISSLKHLPNEVLFITKLAKMPAQTQLFLYNIPAKYCDNLKLYLYTDSFTS